MKPQNRPLFRDNENYNKLVKKYESIQSNDLMQLMMKNNSFVENALNGPIKHWLHILFFGPIFLYSGFMKEKITPFLFLVLLCLGVVVVVFHGYRLSIKKQTDSKWVNLIHVFFVGPLIIALGILQKKAYDWIYLSMSLLGATTMLYNIIILIKYRNQF